MGNKYLYIHMRIFAGSPTAITTYTSFLSPIKSNVSFCFVISQPAWRFIFIIHENKFQAKEEGSYFIGMNLGLSERGLKGCRLKGVEEGSREKNQEGKRGQAQVRRHN